MASVDIQMNDIDYDSIFGGFDALSNHTVRRKYFQKVYMFSQCQINFVPLSIK